MSEQVNEDRELLAEIDRLPRSIAPRRDLWPGIAGRLAGQERGPAAAAVSGWRRYGLAAAVAVAFLTGVIFGRQLGGQAPPQPAMATGNMAVLAAIEASEREYHAAFREFIPLGQSRPMLETQAVQNIEKSWYDLQKAETALLAALQEYPKNTYLNHKLMDLRAQQLGFMKQLAMLEQYSRREI